MTLQGSTIAALSGNVQIEAGGQYSQIASSVLTAQGSVHITAQSVDIQAGHDLHSNSTEAHFKQAGFSGSVSNPLISALQGVQQTANLAQASGQVSSGRIQALGAASTALSGYNTGKQIAELIANPGAAASLGISVSLGKSESQSQQSNTLSSSVASQVLAAGDITITATGAGAASTLTVEGSTLQVGADLNLSANGQVRLQAAQDIETSASHSSSASAAIGVTFSIGANTGFSFQASAAQGSGQGEGQSITHQASHLGAGNRFSLHSGGDTVLSGAVVSASRIEADIGGNLLMSSPQDSSRYKESSQSSSAGVSLCIPPICYGTSSVSAGSGKTKLDSNYQSVGETTGFFAGDGGFDIQVKGKSELKGAQITSSQAAVDAGLNRYSAQGGTSFADLHNSAQFDASSYQLNAALSGQLGDQSSDAAKADMKQRGITPLNKPSGGSMGVGSAQGQASSDTLAGISGYSAPGASGSGPSGTSASSLMGHSEVRTGDASTAIGPIFDKDAVKADLAAQVEITAAFGQMAPKAWADYAETQVKAARTRGDSDAAQAWGEGGAYRIIGHTVLGAASGGSSGASGALASAYAMPKVGQILDKAELHPMASQGLGMLASFGIGYAAGGGSITGGAMAFNVDVNNRQLHPSEIKRINELAGGNAKRRAELEAAGCALVHCSAEFVQGSADYNAAKAKENSAKPADIALLSGQGGDLFVYDPRWYIPGSDASKDLATLGINKTTAIGRDVGKVTAAGTLILTAPLVEKVSPETANNMYGAATEALNAPAEGSTAVKASATVVLGVGLGTGQFVGDTLIGMATLSPTNPKAPEVYAQIGGRAVDGVITLASDPTGSASKAVDAVVSWGGEVKHNAEQIVMADNNGDRLLATTQTTDTAWVLGTTVAGGVGLVRGAAVKGAGLAPEASSVVLSEEVPVLSSANYGKPISGNGAMTMTVYEEEVASGQGLGTGSPWVTGVGDVRRGVVVDRGGANAVGTTTVTTFRVEGIPNQRIMISEAGEISLVPSNESVIWLNFGQEGRASSYLQTKIDKGLPGAELKSFDVDSAFVDKIRADAVPERFARQYPDRPIISRDPYPDQFGLPKAYFDNLINSITQGTGKRGR